MGDGDRFAHDAQRESAHIRAAQHLQAPAGQRGQRVRRGVGGQFRPGRDGEVVHRSQQPRTRQDLGETVGESTRRDVQEPVIAVFDHAGRNRLGVDVDDRGEHPVRGDHPRDPLGLADAVLGDHDDGVRTDQVRQPRERRGILMDLRRQQHPVDRLGLLGVGPDRQCSSKHPVRAPDHQVVEPSTRTELHVNPGGGRSGGEEPADRTHTDDGQSSHHQCSVAARPTPTRANRLGQGMSDAF